MPNWKEHAKSDLREYIALENALESIKRQVFEMTGQITSLQSSQADKVPVQGGTSHKEDMLIGYIDKKARLEQNYKAAKAKYLRIKQGLELLDSREYRILELFYIVRQKGHVERLCEELNVERSQCYEYCDRALKKFTISMYGVIDL